MSDSCWVYPSLEQLRRGSVSECRNPSLQKMFVMIGGGERAGSGYQTIQKGWQATGWRSPNIQTQFQPERVILTLPRVSLIPTDTLEALRARFGDRANHLPEPQIQMLATDSSANDVLTEELEPLTEELMGLAKEVRSRRRVSPKTMTSSIKALCNGRFLALQELARLLNRKPQNLRNAYLTPMVRDGELVLRYPTQPNHPKQGSKLAPTQA